ncbi:acyl-CoA synthetase (AMP-forming)/AMP-acid ligase II [Herbihabitans rhizosphaerae]|uniref:Acyl-CoA synthetase (AMP-forming)/AMP-acid ligase II n=1 Tax=Herbihabitans rhizosphaerae TaxID=1872711 RepID=A0A4Q7KQW6_9PSEU|nr:fatty acyl-AMP ligase [Herbihabitans rhizosphaerae]RZS39248.1 acyl-CoA synthetase (AMP-forming)/AMP-acid ligase II [Herbihabitans rhizosphaerae]
MISSVESPDRESDVSAVGFRSLADLLADWAEQYGDQVAVSHVDYRDRPSGLRRSWTWRQLDERASAVAARLDVRGRPVAVLASQTPHYLAAFLGVLRAGAIAVPLFPPSLPGHGDRLAAVLADCQPAVVLTTEADRDEVAAYTAESPWGPPEVIAVDTLEPAAVEPVRSDPDDVAYLQYTSGSTGTPRGVMITHGNVVINASQSNQAYGVLPGKSVTVGWLPLFHDLGLMLSIACPLVGRMRTVLLDPIAFIERPERWMRALSDNPGAITAAPSFAYAYAAARTPEDDRALLRLDTVAVLIDGSEPIRPSTMRRFYETFEPCGLRRDIYSPSYGLAEATVAVATSRPGRAAVDVRVDRAELGAGRVVPSDAEDAIPMVSCGQAMDQGTAVAIVDPVTREPMPDGRVGEIWARGPNIGLGYWGRPEDTATTFENLLAGESDEKWLRTGDLGVRYDGELYITGRIKDLIVVDGRNHYPQDIEHTAEYAHQAIRRRNVVAFAVDTDDGERAVVLAERARGREDADAGAVADAIRAAVSARHGLALHDVELVEPDSLQRTSSGKITRSACRAQYLAKPRR